MRFRKKALVAGAAATIVGAPAGMAAEHQTTTGPVAVYWMSAATTSGMGGMMGGGGMAGGRPSSASMMQAMQGGYSHSLVLQLGSSRRPDGGAPTAEHDPPPTLDAGPVLPLLSPPPATPPTHQEAEPGPPPQYKQPHGKMLIFWGCGEHAPAGQPLVIDFAQATQGQMPAQFATLMHGMAVRPMEPPSPTRNTTYGEWPNQQTQTSVPQNGSLQGDHFVHGNYSPDIKFSLAADQDFLPPFVMTANQVNPSGSANLGWRRVDGARGYFAAMMGAQGQDQVVMWTSSANETLPFALPDYLSNGEIDRLVASHALMDAQATSCTIPMEAVQATGGHGFFTLNAYGGEANLSYPPRPPAPQPWNIAWEVKIRYKSTTAGMVGMDMSRMMGGRYGGQNPGGYGAPNQGDQSQQQQQQPQHKPSLFNPFGGLVPH
jgi:hypothetical protein